MKSDHLTRFLFKQLGIRGEIVRLSSSWIELKKHATYPLTIESQLGQAIAATVLLSATIKMEGSLILQIHGSGPVRTLVAQASQSREIRGLAKYVSAPQGSSLKDIYGDGKIVLTIQTLESPAYQGIVPLEGSSLSDAIENYFLRSEQLPTRLFLAANGQSVSGLLLQTLPSADHEPEDWIRLNHLASTITNGELLNLDCERLLYRLFNEEEVTVFPEEKIAFSCGCTRDRVERVLKALGREQVIELLQESDPIEIDCEFCNSKQTFDRVDVGYLFSEEVKVPKNETHQ